MLLSDTGIQIEWCDGDASGHPPLSIIFWKNSLMAGGSDDLVLQGETWLFDKVAHVGIM